MTAQSIGAFLEACAAPGPIRVEVTAPGGQPPGPREFDQPFLLAGRDPNADLVLDDPAVSRRHAYLQVIGGRLFCLDLFSRTGVHWPGGPRAAGWVGAGEPLGIGPFAVRVPDAPARPGTPDGDPLASRPEDGDPLPAVGLELAVGGGRTATWRMNRVLALAGHDPRCKVRLPAAGVAPAHCALVRTPAGLWVVDLLSQAGTVVNGATVRWARLADGDELRIGAVAVRVRHLPAPGPGGRRPGESGHWPTPPEAGAGTPAPRADDRQLAAACARLEEAVAAARRELDEERRLRAEAERDRQALADQVAALIQEREALARRVADPTREDRAGPVTPAQAEAAGRFRAAVDRFTALVDEIDALAPQLRARAAKPPEGRWGLFRRAAPSAEGEDAALERRLAALRAEAAEEQQRAELAAAEAARNSPVSIPPGS